MVMLDMMVEIRVPGMSHQRLQDVGPRLIEGSVAWSQNAVIMNMVV